MKKPATYAELQATATTDADTFKALVGKHRTYTGPNCVENALERIAVRKYVAHKFGAGCIHVKFND